MQTFVLAIPASNGPHAQRNRDYFATVGASVHEGRFFSAADQASKLPVAIINEPFANGDCELKEAASDRTRL